MILYVEIEAKKLLHMIFKIGGVNMSTYGYTV